MLKPSSIKIMQESQRKSKLRAYNNHIEKQKKRFELKQIKSHNYRNLNSLVYTKTSPEHRYACHVISTVLYEEGEDFISEYKLKNSEVDIFAPDLSILIEIMKNGKQKAIIDEILRKYQYMIDAGIINDIFIFDLADFTLNLKKDMEMVKNRLGI